MILLVHMLFGAAIGAQIDNPSLAIILAFLGHYFLDLFPHVEYSIHNIRSKNWKKSFPEIIKVIFDFLLGLSLIFIFSRNYSLIYISALAALIPDGLTIISSLLPNKILAAHDELHIKKIHFLKYKKIPNVLRISTQALAIIISIILLKT